MARPEFPRSLLEFQRTFRDERACFDFIVQSRWPDRDFMCPACGASEVYAPQDRLVLICVACKHIQSATAGTVMEGTRQPLGSWLLAAFLVVTDKRGVSAKQLQRDLGLKRYEVAYHMLHKLRAAMVNPSRDRLHGRVEVDESFLGAPVPGKPGKASILPGGKAIIVGAVEVREWTTRDGEVRTRPGRVRLRHTPTIMARDLIPFVVDAVEPGSTVVTDGYNIYDALPAKGYPREIEMLTFKRPQKDVLKHLHLVFSNLKAWIAGTFHGSVSDKHLQAYLNEFTFRFNRRDNLFAAFQTVLGIAGRVKGPTKAGLYARGPVRYTHPGRAP
jgi:hypothetical protein